MDTRPQKKATRMKAAQQTYLEGKVAGEDFTHLQDNRQLLGACLILPALTHCIPSIITNLLSPLAIHAMNLMQSGAGIEAVIERLAASGMEDAESMVRTAIASVPDNKEKRTFWRVVQRLCDEVLP